MIEATQFVQYSFSVLVQPVSSYVPCDVEHVVVLERDPELFPVLLFRALVRLPPRLEDLLRLLEPEPVHLVRLLPENLVPLVDLWLEHQELALERFEVVHCQVLHEVLFHNLQDLLVHVLRPAGLHQLSVVVLAL